MGDGSKIDWLQRKGMKSATWNPVRGCTPASSGCDNCYAPRSAIRMSAEHQPYHGLVESTPVSGPKWTGEVRVVPEMLTRPLRWKKPRMIFVNSMSDLFHGKVPSRFIAAVFGVIAACPQHTFQVLTKRMGRAIAWLGELRMEAAKRTELGMVAPCVSALDEYLVATGESRLIPDYDPKAWPLPNLWFGTSCERQREADNRLRQLRSFDAAVRFASLEPLLEAVSLRPWQGIDWVVVGGESGPNARPFDPEWARYLVAECKTEGIPIFVKQLGSMVKGYQLNAHKGNDPEEWPKDLRVRQWPGEVE